MTSAENASHSATQASSAPPNISLYRLSIGHYLSRALDLVARLGVADQLEHGPLAVGELAKRTGTRPQPLHRLLRLLASAGVFEEQPEGRFSLTAMGELLRDDAPGSMRAMVLLFAGVDIQDDWKELEYCVRTGEPACKKDDPNADPFATMQQDPEKAAIFDRAMATFAPQTAAAVAAAYDFSAFKIVADIGGGNGALLAGILDANPALRGLLFDQPHVIERAAGALRDAGIAERCSLVGGSFFESVPRGADAYVIKHVIHDWNDQQAREILVNCRSAMGADGRLLIIEGVYPARIDQSLESRGAAANDVNMLVCTGGRQRSEAEFRDLLDSAGLRLLRIVPTLAPVAVIEAEVA